MDSRIDLTGVATQICSRRKAELVEELGRGSFKQTFLIRDETGQFALKIASSTPSLALRFEREAAAMLGCSHPAIARLFSSGAMEIDGKQHWVSLEEYLSGGTLGELCATTSIDIGRIQEIARQMISALGHLCERRLVHRDVKPANILFRDSGEAVLTDFGIVRMLDAPTLTKEFLPVGPGTPAYAAPEQLLNEIQQIDWRADQFGLAVVLAECLLGHLPFSPEGDVHLAISRVAQRQQLPPSSVDKLHALGSAYLVKAMSPWPAQRFRSPSEFLAAT